MSENELEFARSFHGHLGPFLALGVLMGRYALELLNARKYFGVRVTIHCPPKPPQSCMVDGLQISTGATYGKGNIELVPSDEIAVDFVNTDTNEKLRMLVGEDAIGKMREWLKELGDEGAARKVISCGEKLFQLLREGCQ
ncbi:MAG: hypothetical protein GDYSWBUE_000724 [Candidatus Fervidibacterota bacterium]